MHAVINTAIHCPWAANLGDTPWALLPVANRPLIDYWLETCSNQQMQSVQVVLGEGAEEIERFVGAGDRWHIEVEYVFARQSETPHDYLESIAKHWDDGLFYIGGPIFLRHRQAFRPELFQQLPACRHLHGELPYFLFGRCSAAIQPLLRGGEDPNRGLEEIHIHPFILDSVGAYFEINMKMAAGEFVRYVTAGYGTADRSSVGFNVRTPPSSVLQAPIIVGDDCRFGTMTTIGPNALIANHVIVDAFTELSNCLILSDTYIGRNLEIHGKIVSGNRVIDPSDGTSMTIDDSWVIARNRTELRTNDVVRCIFLWFVTFGLVLLQFLPFCLLLPPLLLTGVAAFRKQLCHDPHRGYIELPVFQKKKNVKSAFYRLFRGLSLDRFPLLLLVLRGRMFLCGQPPLRHPQDDAVVGQLRHYIPGVFCYRDYNRDSDLLTDALWYAHIRSLFEDLKILVKALVSRFLTAGRKLPEE